MIHDITPPASERLAVYPGDVPLRREVLSDLAAGDAVTLSALHATAHLGAHVDAPSHYGAAERSIDQCPLERFIGHCQVVRVDVEGNTHVIRPMLPAKLAAPRVLLATGTWPDRSRFVEDYAGLSPALIEALGGEGISLIGVDTPSVDGFKDETLPAHAACLRQDIFILEGIDLSDVPDGVYELIALPLRLAGFEASPVRAVLRTL